MVNRIIVHFFEPSGQWYAQEAVIWVGTPGYTMMENFARSLRVHLGKRLSDMTAMILYQQALIGPPVMIKDGGWKE